MAKVFKAVKKVAKKAAKKRAVKKITLAAKKLRKMDPEVLLDSLISEVKKNFMLPVDSLVNYKLRELRDETLRRLTT